MIKKKIKQSKNKKNRVLPGPLPGWPSGQPSPLAWCQSSSTSASRQRRETAHARAVVTRHLPACLRPSPPRRLGPSLRRRLEPLDPLTRPLRLSFASPSRTPERLRRRRSQPPQPQPLPRPLSAYPSSALTPWSYPLTHAIRGSRNRPEHHRLHLRCPEIDSTDSARPELPRLRRLLR